LSDTRLLALSPHTCSRRNCAQQFAHRTCVQYPFLCPFFLGAVLVRLLPSSYVTAHTFSPARLNPHPFDTIFPPLPPTAPEILDFSNLALLFSWPRGFTYYYHTKPSSLFLGDFATHYPPSVPSQPSLHPTQSPKHPPSPTPCPISHSFPNSLVRFMPVCFSPQFCSIFTFACSFSLARSLQHRLPPFQLCSSGCSARRIYFVGVTVSFALSRTFVSVYKAGHTIWALSM
jgi:hypothetical protein